MESSRRIGVHTRDIWHATRNDGRQTVRRGLGAEVLGVDLAHALDDDQVAALRNAWHEQLVLFFRGQDLTPAQFMAFARRIGRPVEYPFVKGIDGYPEIIEVKKLAYETLSEGMRRMLDGLCAVSSSAKADVSRTREDRIKSDGRADSREEYGAEHPVVRTHPATGRARRGRSR